MSKVIIVERDFNSHLIFIDKIVTIIKDQENFRFILKILLIDGGNMVISHDDENMCNQMYGEILKFIGNDLTILKIEITDLKVGGISH